MQAEANLIERITQAYVAYRGVRLLCVLLVLVSAPLLFVLAGGFPPRAWQLLALALEQFPTLFTVHGPAVLLALLGVFLLSATILLAWCALLWVSWCMFSYWRYERRELRSFAVDAQQAHYQAEELDAYARAHYADDEDLDEPQPVTHRPRRVASRRRVVYPLAPLTPPLPDEDEAEASGASAENDDEPVFLEEEEESEMRLYRDEEDDASGTNWAEPQALDPPGAYGPGADRYQDSAPIYDQPLIEHSSPSLTDALGGSSGAESVKHTSYGRMSPFSAAPSVGALPHLTTTLYNRVPMPRSVAPRSTDPLSTPAQPGNVKPAPSAVPQQNTQRTAPEPLSARPEPPASTSVSRPAVAKPMPQASAFASHAVPARPAKQQTPVPAPRSILARPTNKLTALAQSPTQAAAPAKPAPVQPGSSSKSAPVPQQTRPSAVQSLFELISTVPLIPPRAPAPMARPPLKAQAPAPVPVPMPVRKAATQLVVSTGLDAGLKRRGRPNEDSLLALQNTRDLRGNACPVGLFVIADGMGGHHNGQEASQLVIQSLSRTIVPSIMYGPSDDNYAELLAEGVHHANLEVYQRNRQLKDDMGTTIAAALVVNSTAYIVSAGDSRVYHYRARRGLVQVTRDHSTVARLVESGLIKSEDVYTHPRRNEIYRSLGHHPSEDLDKFLLALEPEDVLLLCSDGLWEMVRDEHIQEIIAATAGQPVQSSAALVQAALDGGGKDNISVIVVSIKATTDAQSAWAG